MRVLRLLPIAFASVALLAMFIMGCDTNTLPTAPEMTGMEKPKPVDPGPPPRPEPPGNDHRARPDVPIRGVFKGYEPVWVVSHFAESACNGVYAGAEVKSRGNVSHLGLTTVVASAAWDWAQPAMGQFTPDGPVTRFSATILPDTTHFCSQPVTATGAVTMVAANGDELHGVVTGGEVYELAFGEPGDGQEQFVQVSVVGGTGRFAKAEGQFVLHNIFSLADMKIVQSSIMRGGKIRF